MYMYVHMCTEVLLPPSCKDSEDQLAPAPPFYPVSGIWILHIRNHNTGLGFTPCIWVLGAL